MLTSLGKALRVYTQATSTLLLQCCDDVDSDAGLVLCPQSLCCVADADRLELQNKTKAQERTLVMIDNALGDIKHMSLVSVYSWFTKYQTRMFTY